jgi:hypothetical protein
MNISYCQTTVKDLREKENPELQLKLYRNGKKGGILLLKDFIVT